MTLSAIINSLFSKSKTFIERSGLCYEILETMVELTKKLSTIMFDELNKYEQHGHFFLKPQDNLREVCNAPTNQSGVYIVYALKNGKVELIYIGCSGKHLTDGSMPLYPPLCIFVNQSGMHLAGEDKYNRNGRAAAQ